jgi:hypothetical protein
MKVLMESIKDRFISLRKVVSRIEPALNNILFQYEPSLWVDREYAEKSWLKAGKRAMRGQKTVDTAEYSKWEVDDCIYENRNTAIDVSDIVTVGGETITRTQSYIGHGPSTSLQLLGQNIVWSGSVTVIRVRGCTSSIRVDNDGFQFKATVNGVKYTADVYSDGVIITKDIDFYN